MRNTFIASLAVFILWVSGCTSGSSGTLTGRVVDGFGYPLGGEAVMISLSGNPAVTFPDRWGNFIVHAPVGDYTMRISFSNPAAGFNYKLEEQVRVVKGTRQLGTFTLLNVQNMDAWAAYREGDYQRAMDLFSEQASLARSGQLVFLPYMRYIEGEPEQNTLLTQGVLSAENGLGWTFARGFHNSTQGRIHYRQSLAGGFNNLDAKVGLAGIAFGEGDGQTALSLLDEVIDEPGLYDSSQIHDDINEVDLIVAKSFAQFLLGQDGYSMETLESVKDRVPAEGNTGSNDLLKVMDIFL